MTPARAALALTLVLVAACGAPAPVSAPAPVPVAVEVREPLPAPAPSAEIPSAPAAVSAPEAPAVPEIPSAPEAALAAPVAPSSPELGAEVAQLFQEHCHECHGSGKRPKGGLRLSDLAAVLARPAEEALVVRGDAERSPLYARLVLPEDHEDRMPPEGAPLAAEELALVRRWIEAGAPTPPPIEEQAAPRPDEPLSTLAPAAREARERALAALVQRGAHARRLSAASEAVEVDLAVALPPAGAAELALLTGLEPCLVELSLARLALADADLEALAPFRELRRLRLGETPLGDAALAHLAPLTKLESLDLHATRLTDAAVPALARLGSLRRLYLSGTALSPEALEALTRALPDCTVVR